jgi:hypothetical protein
MLSLLSALLSIVSLVMRYINEKRAEDAGRAKAILAAWEQNNAFVRDAMAAERELLDRIDIDPDELRREDKFQRD